MTLKHQQEENCGRVGLKELAEDDPIIFKPYHP
jgi:hypothetical protein